MLRSQNLSTNRLCNGAGLTIQKKMLTVYMDNEELYSTLLLYYAKRYSNGGHKTTDNILQATTTIVLGYTPLRSHDNARLLQISLSHLADSLRRHSLDCTPDSPHELILLFALRPRNRDSLNYLRSPA